MDDPVESLRWWKGDVIESVMETPSVRTLTLGVPDWAGHAAGQYVDVARVTRGGYRPARSYSIASPPEDGGRLEITVELIPGGDLSPYLVNDVRTGDSLDLRGPLGTDFTWSVAQGGPLLLVAGGSGIAPLWAMLRHRARQRSATPLRLLYSAQRYDDIIYRDALERISLDDPNLCVSYTLTREQPAQWIGYRRRIDSAMLREIAWPASVNPLAYLAGPTSFVESVVSGLLRLGYDPERIHTEWFSPT